MDLSAIIFLVSGAILGAVIGFLLAKLGKRNDPQIDLLQKAKQESETALTISQEKYNQLKNDFQSLNEELKEERNKLFQTSNQKSSLEAEHRNLKEKLQEQKAEVEKLQEKFTIEFKNLANEILEEKSKKFTEQNKSNIGELLNPLRERIEKFEHKVEKTSKENLQWNASLKEQLHHLKELNLQITKEAENLTKALKGDSKAQGNWGEMQLETILEKAGLQKDIHYYKEKNFKDEEGQNQRLDFIIKLPDDKTLVLDSKVSLRAYSNYFGEEDPVKQERLLKQHLDSINTHIKTLSARNYQSLYDITQPDYILMFVANEPALTMALKEDMHLYEKALDRNIVLVSTTTLLATLRTISYIWKQDMQNKNALEIARQAGALYDKFSNFVEDIKKLGRSIETSQNVYKETAKKLYAGQDNMVRKTERLRELGAKASKQLDKKLVDKSLIEGSQGSFLES